MKRLTTRLGMALAGGMGLTLALMWLLSGPRGAELPVAYAAELHVCPSGCPYAAIQAAVDAAGVGDVIKVAAGTYTGVNVRPRHDVTTTGVVTQVVYVSKTITIQGGYTPANWTMSDPTANPTTLNAQGQGRVLYITGDISPTIEGLRLTGGNSAGMGGGGGLYLYYSAAVLSHNQVFSNTGAFGSAGGGLYLSNSAAMLSGNIVTGNTAGYGGGLYLFGGSAILSGNTVVSNTAAPYDGGGVYLTHSAAILTGNFVASNRAPGGRGGGVSLWYSPATLSGNTITGNSARRGGGLSLWSSPATLVGNTIISNTQLYAFASGGGVLVEYSGPTLSGNTVAANLAHGYGGGVSLVATLGAMLSGNTIISNTAYGSGGGLSLFNGDSTLVNNLVADNQANSVGSGLHIAGNPPRLLHTTIARNRGGDGSGVYLSSDTPLVMTNTILVSQTVGVTVTANSTATLVGTLWGSGAWANEADWGGAGAIITGTVNVFGDPGFVDPAAGDYHIGPGSAAIDAGLNAGVLMDIDNQPRPYHAPDLGADEYWPPGALKYVYLPLVWQSH
jgi:hypothetical protein